MYKYGTFLKRVGAAIIDGLIFLVLALILDLAGFNIRVLQTIAELGFVLYSAFFIWRFGSTIGKKVFKLKVVDYSYQKIGFWRALLRESIGKLISGILDLGYLWVLIDKRRQGWHDKIAKTFVVEYDVNGNLIQTPTESLPTRGQKVAFWVLFLLFGFPLVFIIILTFIYIFLGSPVKIVGHSMDPNYTAGQLYMTDKTAYKVNPPQRGDVVIFKNPQDHSQNFIKRIIGVPGDQLMIQGGQVYLDGQVLQEPYLQSRTKTYPEAFLKEGETITVPQGEYFVMGDDRNASSDSRAWGFVTRGEIISKLSFCYWQCSTSR